MASLPAAIIGHLPFSREPLSSWHEPSDVLRYLDTVFGEDDRTTAGAALVGDTRPEAARREYEREKMRFLSWVQRFDNWMTDRREGVWRLFDHPEPYKDPLFGQVAKYFIATRITFRQVWVEDSAFPLALVSEAESDLGASFHLATEYYYRQSFIMLRSYIEALITARYLLDDKQAFKVWRGGADRLKNVWPKDVRGKSGMLAALRAVGAIDEEARRRLDTLYEELNGAVHAHIDQINSEGLFYGDPTGGYSTSWLHRWCGYTSEAAELGIILLQSNSAQWCNEQLSEGRRCPICYGDSFHEMEEWEADGSSKYPYLMCASCQREFHRVSR